MLATRPYALFAIYTMYPSASLLSLLGGLWEKNDSQHSKQSLLQGPGRFYRHLSFFVGALWMNYKIM
jgi:hypothetical protein